jgi:DNA-directed RNA polymerase specialized sigma24 family protein
MIQDYMPKANREPGPWAEMPDAEVLALSRTDPEAFGELVDRYEEAFLRKARSILHSREDAEEVVQAHSPVSTCMRGATAPRRAPPSPHGATSS